MLRTVHHKVGEKKMEGGEKKTEDVLIKSMFNVLLTSDH